MIGKIVSNRYELIDKLSSGGITSVYLAKDPVEGRDVAAQVLYPEHGEDRGFLQHVMYKAHLPTRLSDYPAEIASQIAPLLANDEAVIERHR